MIQLKMNPGHREKEVDFVSSLKGRAGRKFLVMGILNVTPDSFSDGGQFAEPDSAVDRAIEMCRQGADIIDIGAESSRPGSLPVCPAEQIKRAVPVIQKLRAVEPEVKISIDTSCLEVAERAVDAGADIINDISALRNDPGMAVLAAEKQLPVILMHMQGSPLDMQNDPEYDDVCAEVCDFLKKRIAFAAAEGIPKKNIIIDPGFGFGKKLQHNIELLRSLKTIGELGYPLLVGLSRKRMIGDILDVPVTERLCGSIVMNVLSMVSGADILRVHDVEETVQAAKIADAVVI
ncbi:MAG: dihydropteroate synthase [Planctomycetota bacterium]|jgi:dihydropteroate synthase